ncbi:MAG TPA: transketolase [Chloroflexota bacterium]
MPWSREKKELFRNLAREIRLSVLKMIYEAGSGHPGGSLSAVELISTLYFDAMRVDPANPSWADRDRFIASKGHCAPALYAVLAEKGFFPKAELNTFRRLNSILQGHPDMLKTPGVDMSTGSLGHGPSVGVGMALAGRLANKDFYVYVLIGCGESDEGEIWEAAMAAAKYRLDHLIVLLDYNGYQLDGKMQDIMPLGDVVAKWRSFGWNVIQVDGHDPEDVSVGIEKAKNTKGMPSILVTHTVKGKGVSFMENTHVWHGKKISEKEYAKAVSELAEATRA